MNQKLQNIMEIIQQSKKLDDEQKDNLLKALKDTDKELEISAFKLERTEKVKKTTAILLEETIEELEQKRKAVEQQNRELEIEASLERVRAVAMGMNKSEDLLSICEVSFKEFKKLGFDDLRNTIIHILNDEKGYFLDYDYSDYLGGSINNINYNSHPIIKNYLKQIKKANDAFAEVIVDGSELDGWKEFRRKGGQQDDPKLDNIQALYYYLYSIGVGDIGISTLQPINESQINILKRFRNVFDLAYRRYADITKAEAQAREAQIEVALERVRAKTMAMQKTAELHEVLDTIFTQLQTLGFESQGSALIIYNQNLSAEHWMTGFSNSEFPESYKIPYVDHPYFTDLLNAWKKGVPFQEFFFEGDLKLEYAEWLLQNSDFKRMPDVFKKEMKNPYRAVISDAFNKYGMIEIMGLEQLTEERISILKRFSKVFEQSYSRFLDLQKAEEQARESQIELGLERVRARAMAMQKSDELSELVDTVFKELTKLDFALNWCIINIIDVSTLSNMVWAANPDIDKKPDSYHMKFEDYPFHDAMMKGYKERATKYIYVLEGLEKKVYDEYLFTETEFKKVPEEAQVASRAMEKYVCSFTFSNFGGLQTVGEEPLSDENLNILSRFGKVFDLTYTRFNDLQKAEAQAREAQIETALERVRSKAMAMHKSDEISSAVATVFTELDTLGLKTLRCGIGIFDSRSENKVEVWTTSSTEDDNLVQVNGDELLEGHPLLEGIYEAWQRQKNYSYVLIGRDIENYYNIVAKSNLKLPEQNIDAENPETAKQYYYCAMFPAGGLFAFKENEFSEEDIQVMQRFADVFHLTFIRHLDLKQAEAQNKIIQAENERKTAELEEARLLQLAMLPKELPKLPNLDIAVYMQTATEVGGDYYDFQVGLDGTLITIIGDATGHGMKAGTVVTITKSLFNSMEMHENILVAFDKISQVIKGMHFRQLAMCLLMMKIRGNRLSISSAAMPPALIYRANNKTVEEILLKGMPLGTMKKFPYKKIESHLYSGDRILLYSDGLPELANDNGLMYGYDRIKTEFHSVGEKEPEEIVDHLKNSASQWVNGKEPDDDVTFVVLKMK